MAATYNCPSCSGEIVFRTSITVFAVCPYCATMVVRHDERLESLGAMAMLPEDISPIQIGTEGHYLGTGFAVVGRMKIGWRDGVWNEWYIVFDDGRTGWLVEAQGFFAVAMPVEEPLADDDAALIRRLIEQPHLSGSDVPLRSTPRAIAINRLATVTIARRDLRIADVKQAGCIASEGELPVAARAGRQAIYIDLLGDYGEFGGIEHREGQPLALTAGRYVTFEDLRFTNLRDLEGWAPPRRSLNNDGAGDA